jgi:hypothetical protein
MKIQYTLFDCKNQYFGAATMNKKIKASGWKENVKAEWSHLYDPDKPWLEKNSPI